MPQPLYGFVTRYPKSSAEQEWRTTGFQGENAEGCYQYVFSDEEGWRKPIYTRLDLEFFQSKPNDYKVEPLSGRPESQRPTRPTPVEWFDQKVAEETKNTQPVSTPAPAPVAPEPIFPEKKKMGRPPKVTASGKAEENLITSIGA